MNDNRKCITCQESLRDDEYHTLYYEWNIALRENYPPRCISRKKIEAQFVYKDPKDKVEDKE